MMVTEKSVFRKRREMAGKGKVVSFEGGNCPLEERGECRDDHRRGRFREEGRYP